MTNFIPVFPLSIVLYPGEALNLHIFEPRYREMISECIAQEKPFGILTVIEGEAKEFGTLTSIHEVVERYEDGRFDIRTRGEQVFRMLDLIKPIPDKAYSGAIVSYPPNEEIKITQDLSALIINEVKRLYRLLNEEERLPEGLDQWTSYDLAHKCGLSIEQEYELLCIFNELQRLEYLRRHLNQLQPVLSELEQLKNRIRMNGHFRDLRASDL